MSADATHPAAGELAPDFTALTDGDERVSLSDFRGRVVVLFFYPKDDTPGCTVEACSFRDTLPRFDGLDAVVLGISPDSPKSHRKFKKKYELTYTLLSDDGHVIAERYGLWVEKLFWGRKYWGVARTTFVIDRQGRIAHVFEKVEPENHAAVVAAAVAGL